MSTNADGLISLTDLWMVSGKNPDQNPTTWFNSNPIREMTGRLAREGVSPVWKYQLVDAYVPTRTLVCIQVAMAYAQFLGLLDEDKPKATDPALPSKLLIGDKPVATNKDGLISLTDLWKAAGSRPASRPNHWLRNDATKRFVEHLAAKNRCTISCIIKAQRRRDNPGTFAHWQVALAYAKWLSPELHMAMNEVFMRYKAGDPTLAEEVIDKKLRGNVAWHILSRRTSF